MSVVIGDQRPVRLDRGHPPGQHDEEAAVPVALGEQDLAWLDGPRWPRESSAAIGRRPKAWARACRSGEESQQPTCPQVRHRRRCTQSDPRIRHPRSRPVSAASSGRPGSDADRSAWPCPPSSLSTDPCWAGRGRTHISRPGSSRAGPVGVTDPDRVRIVVPSRGEIVWRGLRPPSRSWPVSPWPGVGSDGPPGP